MNEPLDAPPQLNPDDEPLPATTVTTALFIGLGSMCLYCFVLHLVTFGVIGLGHSADSDWLRSTLVLPIAAAIAAIGFIVSVVLIWRVRIAGLIGLTLLASGAVWLVVFSQQRGF